MIVQQTVSNAQTVDGTLVGGLSGLDYDIASGTWILISDDRSEKNPARFYTARLQYDAAGFSAVQWLGSTALRRADGRSFPSRATAQAGDEVPDLEAIRFDPRDPAGLWWTSEGDRSLGLDPFVARADRNGVLQERLPLPAAFRVSATQQTGTRNKLAFEGLSFTPDGALLWVGMEAPLYQDGPVPTPSAGAVTRMLRYDRSGRVAGQVAYPLDPIPAAPAPGENADNGLSNRSLVMVSDNNFNGTQITQLPAFEVVPRQVSVSHCRRIADRSLPQPALRDDL